MAGCSTADAQGPRLFWCKRSVKLRHLLVEIISPGAAGFGHFNRVYYQFALPGSPLHTSLFVQEPEPDDSGPGPGEVSSWDLNTERVTTPVGKLCKTESQNHMSPRLLSRAIHLEKNCLPVSCVSFALNVLCFSPFVSKMENRLQRRPRSTSMKDRQNSKAQSDRTSSMESECSPDSRLIAQVQQRADAAFNPLRPLCTHLPELLSLTHLCLGSKDKKIKITFSIPPGKFKEVKALITAQVQSVMCTLKRSV